MAAVVGSEAGAPADAVRTAYWNRYYAGSGALGRALPSQFATFVAGELESPHRVVDFGCGNGRDALFFSSYGHEVVGVDASSAAVERCTRTAAELGEGARFLASVIDDPELAGRIPGSEKRTVVYARFFLHAITAQEESAFFECAKALTGPGDVMAVEYRTVRDVSQEKVTGAHYRRFIDPVVFQLEAALTGFVAFYAVEGFGYAKYKKDDAYVARCLLRRV